jgi:hypothetical protein
MQASHTSDGMYYKHMPALCSHTTGLVTPGTGFKVGFLVGEAVGLAVGSAGQTPGPLTTIYFGHDVR